MCCYLNVQFQGQVVNRKNPAEISWQDASNGMLMNLQFANSDVLQKVPFVLRYRTVAHSRVQYALLPSGGAVRI